MNNKIRKKDALLFVFICLGSLSGMTMGLTLESPKFQMNTTIPKQYTCNGVNHSPPLSWKNAPLGTKSYALLVDDPDAPGGSWVHWVLFNLSATQTTLDEATVLPTGAISGKNSWGKTGFSGPCPPSGIHHYIFTLYALDTRLTVNSSVNREDILNAMQGHILEKSVLIGCYGK